MTTERVTYKATSPKPEISGNEYREQAEKWLEETNSILLVEYMRTGKYFPDDTDDRDIYQVTINRGHSAYVFTFGQSVARSARWMRTGSMCRTDYSNEAHHTERADGWKPNPDRSQPDAYSILSVLDWSNPGAFADWCSEFGYDTDSRKAEATYKAVVEQYLSLSRMYSSEEMDKAGQIQ